MDIHKAKPVHNWREFGMEIGTIVIGVLIALAAEQAVEWLHWRTDVAEAREALNQEVRENATIAAIRAEEGRCMPARLDEIVRWVNGGPQPDFAAEAGAGFGGAVSTVWEISKAGQVVARMPLTERLKFARFYDGVATQQDVIKTERAQVVRLTRSLWSHAFTADEKARLLADVAEGRAWFRVGRNNNLALLRGAKRMGIVPEPFSANTKANLAAFCRITPAGAG
jgi:hypothetical protein